MLVAVAATVPTVADRAVLVVGAEVNTIPTAFQPLQGPPTQVEEGEVSEVLVGQEVEAAQGW
jgi:hypothetical protein